MYWKSYAISILFTLALLAPRQDALAEIADKDKDGLADSDEITLYHTSPTEPDTDGDGFFYSDEVKNGYSPLKGDRARLEDSDTDGDGLSDALEIALKTNLTLVDTDGDNFNDAEEVHTGYNPLLGNRDRSLPRHAEVNLSTQSLDYFLNNVKIGSMPVSTGLPRTPTPVGDFAVLKKVPVVHYVGPGYNLPNTKWNLEFKRSYYLHGAYWHNQFGIRPMSHGCVNIAYKDVEKLYKFLDVGDTVKIAGTLPKKPLAKK